MLRLFLSLYFMLACALAAFVFSAFFLPERIFMGSVHHHYENIAEGPQLLFKEELADKPVEAWPQHIQELSQHFGYSLNLYRQSELDVPEQALENLLDGRPAIIDGNPDENDSLDYMLLPLGKDELIIGMSIEPSAEEHAERLMSGFFYMLTGRLKEKPQQEWPSLVESWSVQFYFPLRLLGIEDSELEKADIERLRQGSILGFDIDENTERYYKLIENTSYVLKVGPIPNPAIAQIINYLVVGCLAVFVAFAAFLWLRPLWRDMTTLDRSTAAFGRGEFNTRVEVSQRSPVSGLASAFNHMAERVQQLVGSHKELTNAVSHELRTPIARLRFGIDMLRDSGNKADRERYVAGMLTDIEELDSLVNELLTYSRLDRPAPDVKTRAVRLDAWLQEVVAPVRQENTTVDIECAISPEDNKLLVELEPRLMSRALANLLRNAVRYARKRVRISVTAGESLFSVFIEDDGPGIPAGDRDSIFEPFIRLDTSRNRESGGHGLGLAIVKRICVWHQGEVRVSDSELGGARFCMQWPGLK